MNNSTALATGKQTPSLPPLAELVEKINWEHRECQAAASAGLEHALECGRLLQEIKAALPHGEFQPWVQANCEFSDRTARGYLRVAKRWPELSAKRQRVAVLSYREAVKLLAAPKSETDEDGDANGKRTCFASLPIDRRRYLCQQWWDQLATHTLVYDAVGWSVPQIAELTRMAEEDVSLVLDPQPPIRAADPLELQLGNEAFHRLYSDAVAAEICGMLWVVYFQAEYRAEAEGHPEVADQMKAMAESHRRRAERLKATVWPKLFCVMDVFDRGSSMRTALVCVVIDDARAALGIERKEPSLLLIDLMRWEAIIREMQEQVA